MLIVALAALLAGPPATVADAAAAPKKMIWGTDTLPDGSSAFPTYKKLGVDVLQMQLEWRATAPTRPLDARNPDDPAYTWPPGVDNAVAAADKAGIDMMLMAKTTPDWANGNRGAARVPDDDNDYADFLVAATRRYPNVRFWMIWGEPQRGQSFDPMPVTKPRGPRRYARLLDTAYAALKAQNRANKVIGGNTWSYGLVTPRDFVRWMRLPNGQPPRLDYYGHNPFSIRFPALVRKPYYAGLRDISDSDTLAREVARAYRSRGQRPKLWLSEFTVPSEPTQVFNVHVTRAEQAEWITAAFRLVRRLRHRVVGLGWFRLVDTPDLASGLLTTTGAKKPSFRAFQRAR